MAEPSRNQRIGPRAMVRVRGAEELRARVASWRGRGLRVALVPTMGALHEGHLTLVRRARELADRVLVSIFVNPAQFGPGEDYESYPRSPERDCELLAEAGAHLVFEPSVETLYPPGDGTWVEVQGPAAGLEGDQRPGHFRGVATVVLKLLNLALPDVAVFGEKDAQQLAVVRRLVRDLHVPVELAAVATVREADGLALSSRNAYLDADQRRAAQVLWRALGAARASIEAGERDAAEIRRQVRSILETEPLGRIDYVDVVDADSFRPVTELAGRCVVPIAFRLGATRLLDNLQIDLGDGVQPSFPAALSGAAV